ncbi:hypothetical protein P618_200221 [Holospora obtusa F1]|uniref:BON domain-containing protein n=2 Tax=Holospora obtusa TaxID=49893 RepID=W6TF48_HOLOB|nr:hypothetical protein P618_200221 [Holospora obtusa F1]
MFKRDFCAFFCVCMTVLGVQGCGILPFTSQNRTLSETWNDGVIRIKISQDFLLHHSGALDGIETLVYQNNVLLVGSVSTKKLKVEAEKIAKHVDGVNKVWNELLVGEEYFTDYVNDGVMEKKIKASLFLDDEIKSSNYMIRVFKGVLYVLGSASSPQELKRFRNYVDQFALKDVKYFINFKNSNTLQDKKI